MQDTNSQAVLLKNMLQQSKNLKMVQQSCKHLCRKMKMKLPSIADVSGTVFWPYPTDAECTCNLTYVLFQSVERKNVFSLFLCTFFDGNACTEKVISFFGRTAHTIENLQESSDVSIALQAILEERYTILIPKGECDILFQWKIIRTFEWMLQALFLCYHCLALCIPRVVWEKGDGS